MFSRYSRVFAFSTLMLSGAGAQAAVINVLQENVNLYANSGYADFPSNYSNTYSGSTYGYQSVSSGAYLVSEQDEEGIDIASGTVQVGTSSVGGWEGTSSAFVDSSMSGSVVHLWVNNNSSILGSLDEPVNQSAHDSRFAESHVEFSMIFEVAGGNSTLGTEFWEFEAGVGVTADLFLLDLTTGLVVDDFLADDSFYNSYTLFDNHRYSLSMTMDNISVYESSSVFYAQFGDDFVMSVPSPSSISLMGLLLVVSGIALRKSNQN